MIEVGPDTLGERGDAVHDRVCLLQELRVIAAGRLQAQRGLEVVIQVFVRIGLGRIGRQVEQLDLRGTRLVNADLKLIRLSGSCRFKTDTPLSH